MAITCVSTITSVNRKNKTVKVAADITFDTDPTITVALENADVSTAQKKVDAANNIWNKFLVKHSEYLAQQTFSIELTDLEGTLNTNIEGRTP